MFTSFRRKLLLKDRTNISHIIMFHIEVQRYDPKYLSLYSYIEVAFVYYAVCLIMQFLPYFHVFCKKEIANYLIHSWDLYVYPFFFCLYKKYISHRNSVIWSKMFIILLLYSGYIHIICTQIAYAISVLFSWVLYRWYSKLSCMQ